MVCVVGIFFLVAERFEVVFADEEAAGFLHGFDIEGCWDMPRVESFPWKLDWPVADVVFVFFAYAVESWVEIGRGFFDMCDADIVGKQSVKA